MSEHEPVFEGANELTATTESQAVAWGDFRAAVEESWRADESLAPHVGRNRMHAAGVALGYGYQIFGAGIVGVGAFMHGYSHGGATGVALATAELTLAVGAQHVVLGENAVEAVTAYPQTGRTIKNQFPKPTGLIAAYWEGNTGFASHGTAVSSLGVQSAVYNEALVANPTITKEDLRSFTHRSQLEGTVMTAAIGGTIAGIGKSLQFAASRVPFEAVNQANNWFDDEVIHHPVRTALVVTGFTVANAVRKGVQTLRQA